MRRRYLSRIQRTQTKHHPARHPANRPSRQQQRETIRARLHGTAQHADETSDAHGVQTPEMVREKGIGDAANDLAGVVGRAEGAEGSGIEVEVFDEFGVGDDGGCQTCIEAYMNRNISNLNETWLMLMLGENSLRNEDVREESTPILDTKVLNAQAAATKLSYARTRAYGQPED
jgi:hypothetical protein